MSRTKPLRNFLSSWLHKYRFIDTGRVQTLACYLQQGSSSVAVSSWKNYIRFTRLLQSPAARPQCKYMCTSREACHNDRAQPNATCFYHRNMEAEAVIWLGNTERSLFFLLLFISSLRNNRLQDRKEERNVKEADKTTIKLFLREIARQPIQFCPLGVFAC